MHRQGGYTSQHALKICVKLSIFAAFFACPIPFVTIYPVSVGMMWLLLFFGGSLMPTLTGFFMILIEIVEMCKRYYDKFSSKRKEGFCELFSSIFPESLRFFACTVCVWVCL